MLHDTVSNLRPLARPATTPSILPNAHELRLSARLLFVGTVLSLVVGLFHADHAPANSHVAVFTDYAESGNWIAVHLGQFVGIAIFLAGLLVLSSALNITSGTLGQLCRFATISAVVTLALYGVLQAVDGVALKHAVDAWANAPEAEKTVRFTNAETIRWLEWAVRSYYSFMQGVGLVLFAAVIVATGRIARPIGYLMAVSGLAYFAQGWVIGAEGFSANNTLPTLAGIVSVVLWTAWLLIVTWRLKEPVEERAP